MSAGSLSIASRVSWTGPASPASVMYLAFGSFMARVGSSRGSGSHSFLCCSHPGAGHILSGQRRVQRPPVFAVTEPLRARCGASAAESGTGVSPCISAKLRAAVRRFGPGRRTCRVVLRSPVSALLAQVVDGRAIRSFVSLAGIHEVSEFVVQRLQLSLPWRYSYLDL